MGNFATHVRLQASIVQGRSVILPTPTNSSRTTLASEHDEHRDNN